MLGFHYSNVDINRILHMNHLLEIGFMVNRAAVSYQSLSIFFIS